jgi:hypothetical protein
LWKGLIFDYKYIDKWCEFIQTKYKKNISIHDWMQFLSFKLMIGTDIYKYRVGDWTLIIESFMETFSNEKKNFK